MVKQNQHDLAAFSIALKSDTPVYLKKKRQVAESDGKKIFQTNCSQQASQP